MKKNVTIRELIVLGLLIVFAAYYFMVHMPITKQMDKYEQMQEEVDSQIQVEQERLAFKREMERELDRKYQEYNGNPPDIPQYNNLNKVIFELHAILDDAAQYNVDFADEVQENTIVHRDIEISFTVNEYSEVIAKLNEISASENLYLIKNLSVKENSTGSYSVALTMTCFEYVENT